MVADGIKVDEGLVQRGRSVVNAEVSALRAEQRTIGERDG